jgi:hypothetical protein
MRPSVLSLLRTCLAATASAVAAGTVEARFFNMGIYDDAGATAWEESTCG